MPYASLFEKLEQKVTLAAEACFGSWACTVRLTDGRQLNIIATWGVCFSHCDIILYNPAAVTDEEKTVYLKKDKLPSRKDKKIICRGLHEAKRRCSAVIAQERPFIRGFRHRLQTWGHQARI